MFLFVFFLCRYNVTYLLNLCRFCIWFPCHSHCFNGLMFTHNQAFWQTYKWAHLLDITQCKLTHHYSVVYLYLINGHKWLPVFTRAGIITLMGNETFGAFQRKINEFNHHKSNEFTQFLSNGITFLCCSYGCPLLRQGYSNNRVCINDTSKFSTVKSINATPEIVVQVIF